MIAALENWSIVRNVLSTWGRLKTISQYPDRKSWPSILLDLHSKKARAGLSKFNYMELALFRKSSAAPQDYLTYEQCCVVNRAIDLPDWTELAEDKLRFYAFMRSQNVQVPEVLGSFVDGTFHAEHEGSNGGQMTQDAQAALSHLRALDKTGAFFAKRVRGSGGHSAFKVSKDMDAAAFAHALGQDDFLFQKMVHQTQSVRAFHPRSLNTLRLNTVRDTAGQPHTFSAFLRIGRGGAVVDNASVGGIVVYVDLRTGKLSKPGLVAASLGGGYFETHPDTGLSFDGFDLPFFEDCCVMACRFAHAFPVPIIGWDFALTDDGPVLIEANTGIGYNYDQSLAGPMKHRAQFKAFAAHHYADYMG